MNTKMNKLLCMMVVLLSLAACTDDTEYTAGVWYRRSDFDGVARTDAAGFTIGNVGYLCTGYRGSTKDRLKDCWAYDIEANSWTQCTSMPDAAPARNAATGFAVGTKGYIATGYDATKKDYLNDCWQYDPATNSWKEMASIPDGTDGTNIYGKRYYALSFGIGQYGYLGTGYNDNYQKDFWKFDPSVGDKGEWTAMSGFGGQKRMGGMAFVIDDIAYICGGENNGSDVTDFSGNGYLERIARTLR
jgi:N-acetylneuraminic acid mutarotase